MITVRCLGHIGTSVGSQEVLLEGSELEPSEIIERMRGISGKRDPGFTAFNTLLMVEDGEVCVSATARRMGKVGVGGVVIRFCHGG